MIFTAAFLFPSPALAPYFSAVELPVIDLGPEWRVWASPAGLFARPHFAHRPARIVNCGRLGGRMADLPAVPSLP